jgi:hypothetical protein
MLPPQRLAELCSALAKYKKEIKEYLGYLLFDDSDRVAYVEEVGHELRALVEAIDPSQNAYFTKKNLRRIQRAMNRYCRFVGEPGAAAEIRLQFLRALQNTAIPFRQHAQLQNIVDQEKKRTRMLIEDIHEDIRTDFEKALDEIRI